MQDRHEVVLTANITDFKNKMKEAQKTADTMGKRLQNSLKMDKGLFGDNEITRRVVESDNNISKLSVNFGKLSQNMALSRQTMGGVSDNLKEVSENANKVEVNTKNIGGSIDKAFTKGLKSVKRLTIGFLGARSAFMLFRKYLGEYQSQNEEFAAKMQLTTSVITNALAPAFEWFGNVIQYAVIGLARIIELLTGVNILGKTVDNSLKGASGSAKELNDNLSGLDEISNIQEDSGGLSTGIGSQLDALAEFQKKIKEVDDWLKKSGIKKFLEDISPLVKNIFGFMIEHPLESIIGIASIKTLASILPSLIGTAGTGAAVGTGLAGLSAVLAGLAALAVITISVMVIYDEGSKVKKEIDDRIETWKHLQDTIAEATEERRKYVEGLDEEGATKAFDSLSNALDSTSQRLENLSQQYKNQFSEQSNAKVITNSLLGTYKDQNEQLNTLLTNEMSQINTLKELREQGKLTEEQEEKYKDMLIQTKDRLQKAGLEGKGYEKALKNIDTELNNLNNKKVTATIDIDDRATNKINNLWDAFRLFGQKGFIGAMSSVLGRANGGIFAGHWQPITAYAGGGLPNEGQMFVARESGPEMVGTIGGHTAVINNDQIVASVSAGVYEAVLSAMGGQSDRPIVLNVNGKELAKVTYSDYQEEGSRRGTNTSIRRV